MLGTIARLGKVYLLNAFMNTNPLFLPKISPFDLLGRLFLNLCQYVLCIISPLHQRPLDLSYTANIFNVQGVHHLHENH